MAIYFFFDIKNNLATILGFGNHFSNKLFVDAITLLRFATVFRILPTLQKRLPNFFKSENIFSDLENILVLSFIGLRSSKDCMLCFYSVSVKNIPVLQLCNLDFVV